MKNKEKIKDKCCHEILSKIKKDNIKPTPKWQCNLVNWSFWLAVAVAVFLGSIFFSFLLMGIFEIPVEIFKELRLGRYLRIIFQAIPYIWLLLVLASMFLGLVAFHKTRHGHRYQFVVIVSIAMTLVLMLGFFFKQHKIGQPMKEIAESRIPHHLKGGPFDKAQNSILVEDGLLGGRIIRIEKRQIFLNNLFDDEWIVDLDNHTKIKSRTGLEIGDKVLVIGEKEGEFVFRAFTIKEIERVLPKVPKELMGKGLHHE